MDILPQNNFKNLVYIQNWGRNSCENQRKINTTSHYQRQMHTNNKRMPKVSLLSDCSWFKNCCTPLWYCSSQREYQETPAFILAPFPNRYSLISS